MSEAEIGRSLQLPRDTALQELAAADDSRKMGLLGLSWMHRLVRIAIPKSRYAQLLAKGNPDPSISVYRVAKVIGVVPVAGAAATGSAVVLSLEFGDVQDILPTKFVSNEPMTDEEFVAYSAACVRHKIEPLPGGDVLKLVSLLTSVVPQGAASHSSEGAHLDSSSSAPVSSSLIESQRQTIISLQESLAKKDGHIRDEMQRKRLRESQLQEELETLRTKNKDLGDQIATKKKEFEGYCAKVETAIKLAKDGKMVMDAMRKELGLPKQCGAQEIIDATRHRFAGAVASER